MITVMIFTLATNRSRNVVKRYMKLKFVKKINKDYFDRLDMRGLDCTLALD